MRVLSKPFVLKKQQHKKHSSDKDERRLGSSARKAAAAGTQGGEGRVQEANRAMVAAAGRSNQDIVGHLPVQERRWSRVVVDVEGRELC